MTDQPGVDTILDGDVTAEQASDEAPAFHTILEVWRAILTPAAAERDTKITPQWASRICSTYPQLVFASMPTFRDRYFDKIETMLQVLLAEIDTDDACLNMVTPEEDVEHNSAHYVNLLTVWQMVILGWEIDWDCEDPFAPEELAAIAEVHTMIFGDVGLTGLLDQIKFEFTDMHRDALALALQAFKADREGDGE